MQVSKHALAEKAAQSREPPAEAARQQSDSQPRDANETLQVKPKVRTVSKIRIEQSCQEALGCSPQWKN